MKTYPVLLAALLAGCNVQPLEYSKTGDMKSGPGLISGQTGSFSFGTGSAAASNAPATQTAAPPAAQPAKPAPHTISDEEYREFQDWREWKRQREAAGKQ